MCSSTEEDSLLCSACSRKTSRMISDLTTSCGKQTDGKLNLGSASGEPCSAFTDGIDTCASKITQLLNIQADCKTWREAYPAIFASKGQQFCEIIGKSSRDGYSCPDECSLHFLLWVSKGTTLNVSHRLPLFKGQRFLATCNVQGIERCPARISKIKRFKLWGSVCKCYFAFYVS